MEYNNVNVVTLKKWMCVWCYIPLYLEVQKKIIHFLIEFPWTHPVIWIGFVGKINRKQSFFLPIVYGGFRLKLSHQSNDSWDDKKLDFVYCVHAWCVGYLGVWNLFLYTQMAILVRKIHN